MANTHSHGESANRFPLGEILVRKGSVRRYQLEFMVQIQQTYSKIHRIKRLGELMSEHRVIDDVILKEALDFQVTMNDTSATPLTGAAMTSSRASSAVTVKVKAEAPPTLWN